MPDPTARIRELLTSNDPYEPYLHRQLLQAGRLLVENPDVESEVAEDIAQKIFYLFLETGVPSLDVEAAGLLHGLLDTHLKDTLLTHITRTTGAYRNNRLASLAVHPEVCD